MLKNKLLSVLIVILLAMNVILLQNVERLNNHIQNLNNNYSNLQSSINSIRSNVNQSLDQFTREQSRITPIQTNHEKTKVEDNIGLLVLNWQIKDVQEGSEVNFHYRQSESEEFKSVPAEQIDDGFFEVSLPLEIKTEPSWDINVSWSGEQGIAEEIAKEAAIREDKYRNQFVRCYISMRTSDSVKSSEISHLNYDYLSHMKYEPIRGHIHVDENYYNISLFEENMNNNAFTSLSAAFYNGSDLVAEKPIGVQQEPTGMRQYHLGYDSGQEHIDRIVIEVKYENGESFRKEVL